MTPMDGVIREKELLQKFSAKDLRVEERNGAAMVQGMARELEALLQARTRAAERVARRAEQLADSAPPLPIDYTFHSSVVSNHYFFIHVI